MQQLGQIVNSPLFMPECVREVSKACESLCGWVQAVYEYCCMQHQLLLKQQLEVLAKELRGRLHLARQHKEDMHCHLEDVKCQLHLVQEDLEKHLLELHSAESAEQDAATTMRQLETFVTLWRTSAQVLNVLMMSLKCANQFHVLLLCFYYFN